AGPTRTNALGVRLLAAVAAVTVAPLCRDRVLLRLLNRFAPEKGAFAMVVGSGAMFTGVVEELGTVADLRRGRESAVLTVRAPTGCSDARPGDSIAVNGVCLTVTGLAGETF